MGKLTGKTAVITGGAGDIGGAAGALFAAEGAQVLLVDRDEAALEKAVEAVDGDVVSWVGADVTQPEQVQRYVQTAVERYGSMDVFVNNAGIEGAVQPIPDYPTEVFDQVMAVNVRGVWLGLKYAIPEMQKNGGSIIITSSISGIEGARGLSAYVTSKHAVIGLTKSTALGTVREGVRVNAVCPGNTNTAIMESMKKHEPESFRGLMSMTPAGRLAEPEEIANAII